jgi:DNA polymerase-1
MLAIIDGDVLLHMSVWNKESEEEAREHFDELFNGILESTFSTDYVMALGGPDNFRDDLYVDYKKSASRKKSRSTKPDWFFDLKSNIERDYDGCCYSDYCEADDMVRVWAYECDAAAMPRIVVSVDKDLNCIEGKHYNPRSGAIYEIDPAVADRFYWTQILTGDSTDNIPGIKGIGPKKAEGILFNCKTTDQMKKAVCQAYAINYGKEGYSYLITNGRLIHIWRKLNDHFKLSKEFYENAISN